MNLSGTGCAAAVMGTSITTTKTNARKSVFFIGNTSSKNLGPLKEGIFHQPQAQCLRKTTAPRTSPAGQAGAEEGLPSGPAPGQRSTGKAFPRQPAPSLLGAGTPR